jgi:hypothetical protein
MLQNFHMAKVYIKYQKTCLFYLTQSKKLDLLVSFGNCMDEDYIDFLLYIFNDKEINKNIFKNYTPLISIFKDYNQNIYHKFNQLLKINCVEHLKNNGKGIYLIPSDEEKKKKN